MASHGRSASAFPFGKLAVAVGICSAIAMGFMFISSHGDIASGESVDQPASNAIAAASAPARPDTAWADGMQFAQSGEDGWSGLPYWGGNVALNGCGLCAYTSMVDILAGSSYTPADMLEMRGDWEGMDGYMADGTGSGSVGTHAEWTLSTFGIYGRRVDCSFSALDALLSDGGVAIICSHGDVFKASSGYMGDYPGHFVCTYRAGDVPGTYMVHDSSFDHEYGSGVEYSADEMGRLLDAASSMVSYEKIWA